MNIPQQFTTEVDQCLDQAVSEGWVAGRTTATAVVVTLGVLLTRMEQVGDPTVLAHARRYLQAALDLVT